MKTKNLKLSMLILLLAFINTGCQKDDNESEFIEGYITGTFKCYENATGTSNNKPTPRGFCVLLENSKNADSQKPMDFYTFNLPEDFFNFPKGILLDRGNDCGPSFFEDNIQNIYKIRFKYRDATETESVKFSCGMCPDIYLYFPWDKYNQKMITSLSKSTN